MKTSSTFSIDFWLKKTATKKNAQVPIYGGITADGIREGLSAKRCTAEQHWS